MTPSSSTTPPVAMGQQITGQHLPERGSCSKNTKHSPKRLETDPQGGISSPQKKSKEMSSSTQTHSVACSRIKPVFNDNDDFYLLYHGAIDYSSVQYCSLNKKAIKKLETKVPGIFDGLEDPMDLFESDPEKYQPLAKLIYKYDKTGIGTPPIEGDDYWFSEKMTYGEYKGGFYSITEDDYDRDQSIKVHHEHYQLDKESKLLISQLHDFLFDKSVSNDSKIINLQALFYQVKQDKDTSLIIKELLQKMDLIFGNDFKQAQQRAIEYGFNP